MLGLVKQPESIVGVCSRNIDLGLDGDNHFSNYAREHNLVQAVQKAANGGSFAIQGELIAPSIQGNYEQVKGFEYYVFDVFNIDKQEYLLPEAARNFVRDAGLKYVPVLDVDCKLSRFGSEPREMADAILAYAEGPGMNKGVKREGVVFKSNTDVSFSMKAISNAYLMKAK
jgi:ATP-dependent RNA circularization protein (DNA/RNA ligase family)